MCFPSLKSTLCSWKGLLYSFGRACVELYQKKPHFVRDDMINYGPVPKISFWVRLMSWRWVSQFTGKWRHFFFAGHMWSVCSVRHSRLLRKWILYYRKESSQVSILCPDGLKVSIGWDVLIAQTTFSSLSFKTSEGTVSLLKCFFQTVVKWLRWNKLKFSPQKTKAVLVGKTDFFFLGGEKICFP